MTTESPKEREVFEGMSKEPTEYEKALADADTFGAGFLVKGQRVNPTKVKIIYGSNDGMGRYRSEREYQAVVKEHDDSLVLIEKITGTNLRLDAELDKKHEEVKALREQLSGNSEEFKCGDEVVAGNETKVAKFIGMVPGDSCPDGECFITYDGTVAELIYVSLLSKPLSPEEKKAKEREEVIGVIKSIVCENGFLSEDGTESQKVAERIYAAGYRKADG